MANSGSSGSGSKFLSVNLNKSYGRPQSGSGYGGVSGGGSRFPSAGHHGSSGGGGMVVLSRPRSGGAKAGHRLSVPPPMNLPSLRKEHEKHDSATSGVGGAGHGGVGSGSVSGGMRWTKPGGLERDNDGEVGQGVMSSLPAARMGDTLPMMKASVLRGEDFPSLQAALPSSNSLVQKQKDRGKVKTAINDMSSSGEDKTDRSPLLHMRPHVRSPGIASVSQSSEKVGVDSRLSNDLNTLEPMKKQDELFLGPLPLVRLPHRTDWADDERDTRITIETRGKIDDESRKVIYQATSFGADSKVPNRENRDANSWRSLVPKDRHISNEMNEKGGSNLRTSDLNKDNNSRFGVTSVGKGVGEGYGANSNLVHDFRYGRNHSAPRWTDSGLGEENNVLGKSYYERSNRLKNDSFQKSPVSTTSFFTGRKGVTMKDPSFNFGKEKRAKPYVDEPLDSYDFERKDFFPGSFMMKRKKDAQKQLDFRDPVRESFEAELERVQQIQEQERRRVVEEQARALEVAQKEEEDRQRLLRAEEDRRKQAEEAARESACKEEQERLEALRRINEQRTAREEEKKMIMMEEERRKEAAKQKLLELEARIASRQLGSLVDNKVTKSDAEKMLDVGEWEDGERMVERITSSTSETFGVNRPYESSSRFYNSRGGSANFLDKGKYVTSWKRDVGNGSTSNISAYDMGNNFNEFRTESLDGEKLLQRKEYLSSGDMIPSRKTDISKIQTNEYSQFREKRWNLLYESDHLGRTIDIDSELNEIQMNQFDDVDWCLGRSRNMPRSPKTDRFYNNQEVDGFSAFSRPRYSLKQPRVPPPPSLASIHKSSIRHNNDTSEFLNDDTRALNMVQNEMDDKSALGNGYNDERKDYMSRTTATGDHSILPLNFSGNDSFGCDSQSSRSISSPPENHLSHDDISVESLETPAVDNIEISATRDNNQLISVSESGSNKLTTASNVASSGEDEKWSLENGQDLQLQDEYDDDGDEYKRVDDVNEDEDENVGTSHEFEGIRSKELSESSTRDHLILGFDEGVEVKLLSGDEYEKSIPKIEKTSPLQQGLTSSETPLMMDVQSGRGATHSNGGRLETSSELLDETDKSLQRLLISSTETSENSEVSAQNFHYSSPLTGASPSTVQPPSASTIPSSIEKDSSPVQLQFGLFSGPTLFPSPVPAIQIGSIHMPLSLQQHMSPPVAPIHNSDSPSFFQFGQLRYASPISQGVPSISQPISLMHSAIRAEYPLNQLNGGNNGNQALQGYSVHSNGLLGNQLSYVNHSGSSGAVSSEKMDKQTNILHPTENVKIAPSSARGFDGVPLTNDGKHSSRVSPAEKKQEMTMRNGRQLYNNRGPEGQQSSFHFSEKRVGGSNHGKGKRLVYNVKNSCSGSLLPSPSDNLRLDSGGLMERSRRNYRPEFRMREYHDKKQSRSFVSSSSTRLGRTSDNIVKELEDTMNKKDAGLELGSDSMKMHNDDHDYIANRTIVKETSSLHQFFHDEEFSTGNRALGDIDSSTKSGTIQVSKQSGIEVPNEDDDFIEVRSKRQLLNERREQREKEMKLKSRLSKAPRKPRASLQTVGSFSSEIRNSIAGGNGVAIVKGSALPMKEVEAPHHTHVAAVTGTISPPLPPIGTPHVLKDVKSEMGCFRSNFASPTPPSSDSFSTKPFDSEKVVLDKASTPLVPWMGSSTNQQAHLDEAMKPSNVTAPVSCVGDQSFLYGSAPFNSMLSGENIQFGAVSSSLVLSSSNCLSNGIKPTESGRSNISIKKNMPDPSSPLFFEKPKRADELSLPLDDEETEAEAAASAVAVAAITNDDVVSNQLSLPSSNIKNYGVTKLDALPAETVTGKNSSLNHQRSESLSVRLPADLSVETSPLSLWPPLPSPHSNSNTLMAHFPGAPTLPFYEMNPIFGRPIYAFGPQDEPTNIQLQSHKNSSSTTGPVGAWQQCPPGVDSYYGPPNGSAGSFISGPGMQVPPHMVVYNHFAPVGQFGQVGLSYMGTTYVPSGKQPDWKHTPISSCETPSENDGSKHDAASNQQNPVNMSGSVQHLASGSPLLPLPPPLAWLSPFQTTPDVLMSARWPQETRAHIQSIPSSMSLKQTLDDSVPQQFNQSFLIDPTSGKKLQESQASNSIDGKLKIPTPSDSSLLSKDLGMLGSKNSIAATVFSGSSIPATESSVNNLGGSVQSSNHVDDITIKTTASIISSSTSSSVSQNVAFPAKSATPHQQPSSASFSVQKANGSSQKANLGNEWRGRGGSEKGFVRSSKVKQIYVAKGSMAPGSTPSG